MCTYNWLCFFIVFENIVSFNDIFTNAFLAGINSAYISEFNIEKIIGCTYTYWQRFSKFPPSSQHICMCMPPFLYFSTLNSNILIFYTFSFSSKPWILHNLIPVLYFCILFVWKLWHLLIKTLIIIFILNTYIVSRTFAFPL